MSASLLDIAPRVRVVPINGTDILVRGLSAEAVVGLLERFPALRTLLFPSGGLSGGETLSDPLAIVHGAPAALAAILAAGTGSAGSPEHEDAARALPVEDQVDLLTGILALTLPNGFVPFMTKLTALIGSGVADDSERSDAPNSASSGTITSLPNGKALDISSPSQLNG